MTEDCNPKSTQAIIIFIDNSDSSIDGDFRPTRLEAQKNAVEAMCGFFRTENKQSVFGFGSMSNEDFGIKTSFTEDTIKVHKDLEFVKPGGTIQLEKAIRSGLLAMKQRPKEVPNQTLIFFVSSQHDLTNENAELLANLANRCGASLNIFVFGDQPIDEEPLKLLIEKKGADSHYNRIPIGTTTLADIAIKTYCNNFQTSPTAQTGFDPSTYDPTQFEDDPQLREALQLSLQDDPQLQAALEASIRENQNELPKPPAAADPSLDDMEDELRQALEMSTQDFQDDAKETNNEAEEPNKLNDDIQSLLNDPDQLASIVSEFGGKSSQNDSNDKPKNDKNSSKK